jgi:hypothetical protein
MESVVVERRGAHEFWNGAEGDVGCTGYAQWRNPDASLSIGLVEGCCDPG